jgi:virulence-associated protein VapD
VAIFFFEVSVRSHSLIKTTFIDYIWVMYTITFDLDTEILKATYPKTSFPNANNNIKLVLAKQEFVRQQGSVYFGGTKVTAVTCSIETIDLQRQFHGFAPAVQDLRMLSI